MTYIENVRELDKKGSTRVKLVDVVKFLGLCTALGIMCCAGTIDEQCNEQVFFV